MRRVLFNSFVAILAAIVLSGCDFSKDKGEDRTGSPTSPSGTPITSASPKITLSIGRPLHQGEPGRCYASATLKGSGGAGDLIQGLPVARPVNPQAGESWSGSWMRIVDWGYNKLGAGAQTAIPFVPGTTDHFQFDDVPFDCASGPNWTFEIIYGGNIVGPPDNRTIKPGAEMVAINLNSSNVKVVTVSGVEPQWQAGHMIMNKPPY